MSQETIHVTAVIRRDRYELCIFIAGGAGGLGRMLAVGKIAH